MTDIRGRPIHIDPCSCGADLVRFRTDGISLIYHCAECGELLADLMVNVEL